eukprot:GILJ01002620.1.p1 GENE.GILJ01002620.1~~GILJ01002620.1.p1  ORF type:complete len:727 (+),score=94.69 GILJ01002620.1:36-2216(+)
MKATALLCLLFLVAASAFDDRGREFCLLLWGDAFGDVLAKAFYSRTDVIPLCYTYPVPQGKNEYEIVPQIGVLWNKEKKHADLVMYKMTPETLQRVTNPQSKSGSMRMFMDWWVSEKDGVRVAALYNSFESGYRYVDIDGECVGFDRGHLAPFHDFAFYTSSSTGKATKKSFMAKSNGYLKALAQKWEDIANDNQQLQLTQANIRRFAPGELDLLHYYLPAFNSFVLSNQVPQEKRDNSGYWKASVENKLRKDLHKLKLKSPAYIVTGTLWDYDKKRTRIFTKVATANNGLMDVPVPRNLFKVAFVKASNPKAGTAARVMPYMALDIRLGRPCYDANPGSTATNIASRVVSEHQQLKPTLAKQPGSLLLELQRVKLAAGTSTDTEGLDDVNCRIGFQRFLRFFFRLYTDAVVQTPAVASLTVSNSMPALRTALAEIFSEITQTPSEELANSSVWAKFKEKVENAVKLNAAVAPVTVASNKRDRPANPLVEPGSLQDTEIFDPLCAFTSELNNAYLQFVRFHKKRLQQLIADGVDLQPGFKRVLSVALKTFVKSDKSVPQRVLKSVLRAEFSQLHIVVTRPQTSAVENEPVSPMPASGQAKAKRVKTTESTPDPDQVEPVSDTSSSCEDQAELHKALSNCHCSANGNRPCLPQSHNLNVASHHVSCNNGDLLEDLLDLGVLDEERVSALLYNSESTMPDPCQGFEESVQQEFYSIRERIADVAEELL